MSQAILASLPLADDQLINHLSMQLRVPARQLNTYTRLFEDLLLDQYDRQLLIATLESHYNCFLTEEETQQVNTVGDLQRLFSRQAA